ncbi:axoneme-associated protein mst101(2)-like [Notolabrus celidotus]|uniref:axoneme-associated protein mst101(2)-like n=1 Tax=Notolabrus celidotus TaxID=1203425 RepID=UPI0014904506|nr:axoneme-associated protein mst101(2)-like [Notolabrus celidotus]
MSLTDQLWSPTSVQVTVLQARGLRIKGKSGTNDAYAVMQVGKEKYQTSVVEKSVAPMWKEEAAFDLMPAPHQGAGGTLHVHVLHRALVGPDKLLGQAVINLLQLSEDKTRNKTEWFKLLDKTGKPDKDRGEVLVDIQFLRNNMTASMFDLSGAGKSRSRLGKFKDKVRGKKKESDTSSNVVPSFTQVLTDSEEEEGHGDGEVPAGKDEKKKKLKIKSLFSPKSNLQKNMSQSMSVLPGKNSPLSGSISSGLNVDASEGKKKFKFKIHKRTGSSDNKDSSAHQKHATAEQSNVCINGSHIYCEEPPPRTSRIGSNYSLASSGHGSMEDVPDSSPPSVDSLRAVRQYSPWTEEEEEEEAAAVKPTKDEEGELRSREEERMEEERRKEEEEREGLAEEKRRQEEENRRAEEEKAKWEEEERIRRAEEDRVRRHEEELKRLAEEKRRQEDEERRIEEEKMKKEEEERKRKEEEESKRQEEEERVRREEEHARLCEEKKKQEEQERQKIEEEERRKREEEEMIRLERERAQEERRKIEEEERARRLVEEQKLEEEERRVEEEERRRIKEEKARQEEEERIRREEERVEEDRRRQEEEEVMRRQEEEQKRRLEEQESERRQREEEERSRKEEEEEEKVRKEEYERLVEEKRKQKEEEKKRIEAEEQKRRKEEEQTRLEEERKKLQEMRELEEQEKRRLEEEENRKREEAERISWEEERRKEEEERVKKEKEEYERQEELERRRVEGEERARKEEQERIEEERRRNEKEEEQVRKEIERLAEEKRRLEEEEEERSRIEEEEKRQREEEERVMREMEEMERLAEEKRRREEEERSRIKEEEQKIMEKKKKKEEDARKLEKEKLEKEAEEQMKREIKIKHKAAGRKVDLEISAEVMSSNPFDENYSSNPFEEISSSPAEPDRCQSAASTNDKDLITSQRGKRAAPKPPGDTQAERQMQREQDGSASRHLAQINKQSKDKDAKALSLIPTRSVKKTAPVKGPATGTENVQSSKVNSAAKVTTSVAKPGKRVAPPRPGSGESEPKAAQAPERKTSKTKEEPIVYGLNPFEEDEDENELTAQGDTVIKSTSGSVQLPLPVSQPVEKDTASQTKVKSFKMAPAPPLPVTSTDTSSSSISQSTNGELVTGDSDRSTLDNDKTQDPKTKTISLVQVKEVSLQESQHATLQTAAEEAGDKKDAPPPAPRRLQPVKPLNPLEQQSVPVVDREKENKSAGILCEVQEKTQVNDTGIKGPYSQLTRQELISMVLKQENQLKERDKTISELEQYIDNLLVRVIEEAPTILNSLNCLKKAV